MSPLSGLVLCSTAVVASPVLLMVRDGTMTVTEAAERGGIVLAICWAALTFVESFAFPPPGSRPVERDGPTAQTAHGESAETSE